MKKVESDLDDELREQYDLAAFPVRKLGPGRKRFGDLVSLKLTLQMHFQTRSP